MATLSADYPTDLSHDRLGFAFCVALAIHAALILGVTFNQLDRNSSATKIEITLAQHKSDKEPNEVDFLAQHNQQGSGTLDEKAMLTSNEQAEFLDNLINDVSQQQVRQQQVQQTATAVIASTKKSDFTVSNNELKDEEEKSNTESAEMTILEKSREIASLEARLDIQRQAFAKRPRVKRLTSLATKQADDALYLHNWRSKIEAVGNKHYPVQAKQNNIYGDLRLLVSLLPNGAIHKVQVLHSSGYSVLDEAAIRIVHLGAPYAPFPMEMRDDVDLLQIIRTWRFHKDNLTTTASL